MSLWVLSDQEHYEDRGLKSGDKGRGGHLSHRDVTKFIDYNDHRSLR